MGPLSLAPCEIAQELIWFASLCINFAILKPHTDINCRSTHVNRVIHANDKHSTEQ